MVAETFAPRAHRKLAGRLPGEDLEAYVERLATQLEERLAEIEGPRTDIALYDQRNRPIVTSQGIYGYNASGLSVVAPDIVQIDTEDLVDAAIKTAKLADNAVTELKVLDAAISTAKIADAAIVSAKIGDLQVITAKIDDLAVNNAKIANMAVDKLTAGVIGASGIYVGSTSNATEIHIDGPNNRITISDEATPTANPMVYLGKLPDTSYGIQILDDAGATVLKSSSTGSTFAASLDASKITVSNLDAGNITAGTLSVDRIGANSITAAKIAANTITSTEIAGTTITASNIAANTITASQIAANTITGTEISAGAVDTAELAADAVTAAKIAANTITASEIAANTITGSQITGTTLSGIFANLGTITAGTINGVTLNTVTLNADQATINNLNFSDISQGDLNTSTQLATDALTETSFASATTTADLPVGEGSVLYTTIAASAGDEFLIEIAGTWNLNGTDYPSGGRASIGIGQSVSPHVSVGVIVSSFNAIRWEVGEDGEKSFALGWTWSPPSANTYRIHLMGDAPGATTVDSVRAAVKVTRLTPQG